MTQECACLCAVAGHYGICRVDAEAGLVLPGARHVIAANRALCRSCYRAQLPRRAERPVVSDNRGRERIAGRLPRKLRFDDVVK